MARTSGKVSLRDCVRARPMVAARRCSRAWTNERRMSPAAGSPDTWRREEEVVRRDAQPRQEPRPRSNEEVIHAPTPR